MPFNCRVRSLSRPRLPCITASYTPLIYVNALGLRFTFSVVIRILFHNSSAIRNCIISRSARPGPAPTGFSSETWCSAMNNSPPRIDPSSAWPPRHAFQAVVERPATPILTTTHAHARLLKSFGRQAPNTSLFKRFQTPGTPSSPACWP